MKRKTISNAAKHVYDTGFDHVPKFFLECIKTKPLTKSLCLPLRTKTLPLRFITYCFQSSSILPLNSLKFYLFACSSLTMLGRKGEERGECKTANLSRRISSSQTFRGEGAPVYKGGWSQFGYPRQEVNVFTLEGIM